MLESGGDDADIWKTVRCIEATVFVPWLLLGENIKIWGPKPLVGISR